MYSAISNIGGSTLGKSALSAVSTAAAYVLIPIAYQYATTDLSRVLVMAVVAAWAISLTRMWGEVISLTAQAMAKIPVPEVLAELATVLPVLEVLDPVVGSAL